MYNPQLDTFLRMADAGSFNKAAEDAYITPTAVINQSSGSQDTKYIIQYYEDSVVRARNAMQADGFEVI